MGVLWASRAELSVYPACQFQLYSISTFTERTLTMIRNLVQLLLYSLLLSSSRVCGQAAFVFFVGRRCQHVGRKSIGPGLGEHISMIANPECDCLHVCMVEV